MLQAETLEHQAGPWLCCSPKQTALFSALTVFTLRQFLPFLMQMTEKKRVISIMTPAKVLLRAGDEI